MFKISPSDLNNTESTTEERTFRIESTPATLEEPDDLLNPSADALDEVVMDQEE